MAVLNLRGKGGSMFLEPGDHLVYIYDIKDNERTAKPSIDVFFKDDHGHQIKDMFSLTEAAGWRIARLAIAAECYDDENDPRADKFNTNDLIGKQVMVQVVKETNARDGKEYSTVKNFWKVNVDAQALIAGLKGRAAPATEEDPF